MIQVGEVRQDMLRALSETLEYVLNKKKDMELYYILIYCKLENDNCGITKVVILPQQPPKMIGTTCYKVDNLNGTKELLWLLPIDIPLPEQIELESPEIKIFNSAQDMPIVH